MDDDARRLRAEERRQRIVLHRAPFGGIEPDPNPIRGEAAISLATRLTREAWSLSGRPWPTYSRSETPCRFVPWQPE